MGDDITIRSNFRTHYHDKEKAEKIMINMNLVQYYEEIENKYFKINFQKWDTLYLYR